MTTKTFLVAIFSRKTPFFGDEALSRRHFWVKNSFFGRRNTTHPVFGMRNSSF
ncbi:hypothetical protein NST61_16395 [Caldifermentibacillus hisashii]|uniref:hypothetical protein n=1 Tax=Caldifermentibacillus hisashii TaxID=996558 RepID=UPI0034D6FD3D